jgi:hypothetical protein
VWPPSRNFLISESFHETLARKITSAPSDVDGPPPAGGGSKPESATITGTLIGVILGVLFLIAGCVAVWFLVVRRNRKEEQEAAEDDGYEIEIEAQGELTFEVEEQFDSCDGGTNFDQDENTFIDQGFEANLFGNALEEGEFQF